MLRIIQATSNQHSIKYPSCESEFEVQSWLFHELKSLGFDVRGEVQHHGSFGLRAMKASCRFDLVIYSNCIAVAIIEVKAKKINHKRGLENTRQGWRYPTFGVPVMFVYGLQDAVKAVEHFKTGNGLASEPAFQSR